MVTTDLSDDFASVFLVEASSVADQLEEVQITVGVLHYQTPATRYFEVGDILRRGGG